MSRRRNLYFSIRGIPAATTLHPRWNDSGDPTIFGTDKFGFNLLPSGIRNGDGTFANIGYENITVFPSATPNINAVNVLLADMSMFLTGTNYVYEGLSIRAVREATTAEILLPDGLILATYTDYDGNVYPCTKIGLQVWTTLNLKTTHYVDGTLIPTNLSNAAWTADTAGAMAVYGKNDGAFVPTDELTTEELMVAAYGRLYNWYTVNNIKGLIDTSTGFRVPTDAEFTTLTDYLIATYPEITTDNVGDVLKSTRQVNSPYII